MWITLGILIAAIVLFITEWLRVDLVALLVVVALMLSGILTTQEAIAGFANPAILTIASLFVIGGGVMQVGLAGRIGQQILSIAGEGQKRLVAVIMLTVALLSGFLSSTGMVAVLLPAITSLSRKARISPSKLLMPLSFGALLGGAMTLIGTTPNIIVNDLLNEHNIRAFAFFDYTPIGILLLIAGVGFMLFIGLRLLPEHQPQTELHRIETPEELVSIYRLPDNLYRLRVRQASPLINKSLEEAHLRQRFNLTILEIQRPPKPKEVAKLGERRLMLQTNSLDSIDPDPETGIQANDILIAQGNHLDISYAAANLNLGVQPAQSDDQQTLISDEVGVAEVLLPPRSSLLGRTIVEARFGTLHHLTVLGIHRSGEEIPLDFKETRLRFGDTLLVQGPWKHIHALRKQRSDFVVMGEPEAMFGPPNRKQAPIALAIVLGMLALLITNALSVTAASMLAALAMILTGCLSIDEAYANVDWKSIVLIAGMLPMSTALEKVGLVEQAAGGLTTAFGNMSPLFILGTLFLITSGFTQVLSNTATTVLIAPIALATAQQLGIQPHAFMMTVAIAASMAFASPVASPPNTLVMGGGDYQFSDYIKVGTPLLLITMLICVLAMPFLWPL
jgi:di/tricarboxylate transporter